MLHVPYVLCSGMKFYSRDIRYYIRCILATNGWTWQNVCGDQLILLE